MSDLPIRPGGSFEELMQRQLNGSSASGGSSRPTMTGSRIQNTAHPAPPAVSFASQFEALHNQFASFDEPPHDAHARYSHGGDEFDERLDSHDFEDARHDEQELKYNDNDEDGYDDGAGRGHPSSLYSDPSFETSFPLPSLARTHPLSPLKESSQEIDTERLRRINMADPRDQDSGYHDEGDDDHLLESGDDDRLDGEESPTFGTALYQASPVQPAAHDRRNDEYDRLHKSHDDLDEFERLEAQAREEAAAEEEMQRFHQQQQQQQQQSQPPKKLRPSHTQLNNSLTRQQMLMLDEQQRGRDHFGDDDDDGPYQPPAHLAASPLFDDDEEWTDQPKSRTHSLSIAPTDAPGSRIPVRSPPRARHQPLDEDEDYPDSEEIDQRDPLSVAQVIPPSVHHRSAVSPSPSAVAPPPTSGVVKKYFADKKATSRPSSAPAARRPATAPKTGSNKKKPVGSTTGTSEKTGEKTLASEMERYTRESARLKQLSREQEQELASMRREKAAMTERLQAERDEFERFRDEETKKLRAARVQLEKDRRALTGAPDRRDREQMEELRRQVATLTEELHTTHEKAKSAEARSRRDRESLQSEVKSLKSDMAAQEARRLDEWEEREAAFNREVEAQKKRDREERERKEREKKAASVTVVAQSHPTDAAHSTPQYASRPHTAPSSALPNHAGTNSLAASQRSTAAPMQQSHHQQQHYQPASSQQYQQPSQQQQQQPQQPSYNPSYPSHHSTHPPPSTIHTQAPPPSFPPAVASSTPAPLSFSTRPPPSNRGLIDRGPATHTLTVVRETTHDRGQVERLLSDQSRLILFKNGTTRRTFADGFVVVTFPNGDKKQTEVDGRIIYYYHAADTTHTTYTDGMQLYEFSNGQTEKHYPDGRKQIFFSDGTVKNIQPDGTEETRFPNGTVQRYPPTAGGQ